MMLAAGVGWKLLAVAPTNGVPDPPGEKYAAIEAAVGQSRRQCRAAGNCDGYTRSWLRYATCTALASTGVPTPCRFTNNSPPSCCDQPWMPPRDAQNEALTLCTVDRVCELQP